MDLKKNHTLVIDLKKVRRRNPLAHIELFEVFKKDFGGKVKNRRNALTKFSSLLIKYVR